MIPEFIKKKVDVRKRNSKSLFHKEILKNYWQRAWKRRKSWNIFLENPISKTPLKIKELTWYLLQKIFSSLNIFHKNPIFSFHNWEVNTLLVFSVLQPAIKRNHFKLQEKISGVIVLPNFVNGRRF